MKIAFYKWKGDWLDKLIRLFTWQPYSHCELIFPSGESFSSSERDWGVRFKNIAYIEDNWDIVEYYVWKYEVERLYKLAKTQCWKKYDFFWILLSIVLPLWRQNPDKWFCSEICWYLLWVSEPHTLTPWDLYNEIIW